MTATEPASRLLFVSNAPQSAYPLRHSDRIQGLEPPIRSQAAVGRGGPEHWNAVWTHLLRVRVGTGEMLGSVTLTTHLTTHTIASHNKRLM